MKRTLSALALMAMAAAFAAQMTGIFIGDRERTLYVGGEPFCLVFPQPVLGGKVDTPGFALAVQDSIACFTALDPGSQARATLTVGDRTLSYVLKARLDAPSAEIRVIFPGEPAASPSNQGAPPAKAEAPQAVEAATAKPSANDQEAPEKVESNSPLPVPEEVRQRVVTPEPDPTIQRLESIIAKLDRVLRAQEVSEGRYLPESVTEPSHQREAGEEGEGLTPQGEAREVEKPASGSEENGVKKEEASPQQGVAEVRDEAEGMAEAKEPSAGVGYDPVEDPLPQGVRVITSLVPGKHAWRITYTLYNDGDYPLITDPNNVRILFNGEAVETGKLKQRTSSGYAGWVPPGYEEVGSVEVPPLDGQGELRLEFDLTRLSPERENLTIVRRWKITTMPYVVPNQP